MLGNAALYGVSITLSKLVTLLLLPVVWGILAPSDLGILGVMQIFQSLLIPVLSLGMHDAVMRFLPEWAMHERNEKATTVLVLVAVWGAGISVILSASGALFESLFKTFPANPYLCVSVWSAYFSAMTLVPLGVMRVEGRVKWYSICSAGMILTQLALSLIAITVYPSGVVGYMFGSLIANMLWSIVLVLPMLRGGVHRNPVQLLKELAGYSLPALPTTILDGATGLLDRYFLDKHVSLSALGLYNVAHQFGSGFNVFNQSLKSAWFPFVFRLVGATDDAPRLISRYALYYVALLAPIALGVAVLSKELLMVLADGKYAESYVFVPWVVLALYFQSITSAMGRGLDLARKSFYWPLVSVVHLVVAIFSLGQLVPLHGASGAAQAIGLTAGTRAVIQICLAHWVYPRPFPFIRFLVMWIIGLATFYLCYHLPTYGLLKDILFKTTLIFVGSFFVACAAAGRSGTLIVRQLLRRT
jgi:O-antigen/teichoic acid export membrane protein